MKVLFENKKAALNTTLQSIFMDIVSSVIVFILFKSLITWSKPKLNEITLFTIVIITLLIILTSIIKVIFHNYRLHLESIVLDTEEKKLIIKQVRLLKSSTKTVMKLSELKTSEIKHFPFSSFSFYNYFSIRDNSYEVKISTAGHGDKEIDLNGIYKELNKARNANK